MTSQSVLGQGTRGHKTAGNPAYIKPTCHVHDVVACAGAIHKTKKKASEIVAKQTKYKIQQKTKYNVSCDTCKFLIDTIDLIGHCVERLFIIIESEYS